MCRLTSLSASEKSPFRPLGARLECAWARCSFNCPSNACHTGFQYCAVDSITASCTPDSASPTANPPQFRVSSAEFTPLKTELAHLRCIRNYHRQHLLVYVDTGYSVRRFHSPFFPDQGRERTGKNLKHHFALKPTPASGISNAHLFVQTHAPDQTGWRPQPIHCPTDLNYPAPLIWM